MMAFVSAECRDTLICIPQSLRVEEASTVVPADARSGLSQASRRLSDLTCRTADRTVSDRHHCVSLALSALSRPVTAVIGDFPALTDPLFMSDIVSVVRSGQRGFGRPLTHVPFTSRLIRCSDCQQFDWEALHTDDVRLHTQWCQSLNQVLTHHCCQT